MKRIVFSVIGSMLISVCALQAQQTEDQGTARRDRDRQQQRQSERQRDQRQQWHNDKSQPQDAYANEGMVIIDKSEIPASLKETLEKDEYEGWENGTIYHNTNTGEYVIAPRAFRFDKDGKEIDPSDARQQSNTYRQAPDEIGAGTQTQPGQSGREQYSTEDMIEVQAEQIPESLRRTLSDNKYQGWEENGTLYQDPTTSDYVLVMDKRGNATVPRMYRFDRNGKLQN